MCCETLLKILPEYVVSELMLSERTMKDVREIRLRVLRKPVAVCRKGDIEGQTDVSVRDIERVISCATGYSVYAFEANMAQGFMTIKGGHRIGIGGQVIWENGRVKNFLHVTFLCIRVAREVVGCADCLMDSLLDGGLKHTLIISPPGFGKTTLLRDIVRQLSDREKLNISLIDERSEIAACVNGVPQNDVGKRTDVIDGCEKSAAVYMAVRALSPQVIAMDEIGGKTDVGAVRYCIRSGCVVIGTAHGGGIHDTDKNLYELFGHGGFERAIILKKRGEGGRCLDLSEEFL